MERPFHAPTPCGPTAECPIFRGSCDTDSNTLLRWGGARDSGGHNFSGSLEPYYWTVTPTSNNTENEIGHAQLCASQTSTTITTHHTNTHTTAHTQMLFPHCHHAFLTTINTSTMALTIMSLKLHLGPGHIHTRFVLYDAEGKGGFQKFSEEFLATKSGFHHLKGCASTFVLL